MFRRTNHIIRSIALCLAFGIMLFSQLHAQQAWWIYFADKDASLHLLDSPAQFLTRDAIARRQKHDIEIRFSDLPVSQAHVEAIRQTGATIRVESRWLNAVSITLPSEDALGEILALPFVTSVTPVKRFNTVAENNIPANDQMFYRTMDEVTEIYGGALNQNHMIEVDFLHGIGYRGQGVKIAVLDGGFYGVDWGEGFASLHAKDQIKEVFNFAEDNTDVYISSTHGSNVLSIMAVDMPGVYVGSAPDAEYYLFRTEVTSSEFVVEEDYWLAAAEYADFIGADIINSSLGYTTFDDPLQDHTYADMDGNTTVVTKAADMAAAAGILVVNSAGNSGDEDWNFIGAPADGDSVFTIGAVDLNGIYASFSSEGPTSDGRIKPNVVGQGAGTAVMLAEGTVAYGSGTSYSSPLIAGACASFMSAFPDLTNMEVISILQSTASRAAFPNNQYGYGIPSFAKAYLQESDLQLSAENVLTVIPNPATESVTVYMLGVESAQAEVGLYSLSGQKLASAQVMEDVGAYGAVRFDGLDQLASGIYLIRMAGSAYSEAHLLYVQ